MEPSAELLLFFWNNIFGNFIEYLKGDPLMDRDLKRSDVSQAKACIILSSDKNAWNYHEADHWNILIGLAIKKYVYMTPQGTKSLKNDQTIRLCI